MVITDSSQTGLLMPVCWPGLQVEKEHKQEQETEMEMEMERISISTGDNFRQTFVLITS